MQGLARTTGNARVDLRFDLGETGVPRIRGTVEAAPEFVCQRCLRPVVIPVAAEIRLAVVTGHSEPRTEDGFEPLETGDDPISLITMVEDEIILALPDIPVHASPPCSVDPRYARIGDEASEAASPFAALAGLKTS